MTSAASRITTTLTRAYRAPCLREERRLLALADALRAAARVARAARRRALRARLAA